MERMDNDTFDQMYYRRRVKILKSACGKFNGAEGQIIGRDQSFRPHPYTTGTDGDWLIVKLDKPPSSLITYAYCTTDDIEMIPDPAVMELHNADT